MNNEQKNTNTQHTHNSTTKTNETQKLTRKNNNTYTQNIIRNNIN